MIIPTRRAIVITRPLASSVVYPFFIAIPELLTYLLLPLDCAGGFAGNVVDDAVDAVDFVDDPAGDGFQ